MDTCASKGISTVAAKEGTCVRDDSSFGRHTTFNVVDSGHALQMPGFDARLLASVVGHTTVFGPALNSTDYPNGDGLVVSLELSVTNTGSAPLEFDQTGTDVDILIPPTDNPAQEFARPQVPYPAGAPGPQLDQEGAISAGQSLSGWVSFVAPIWATPRLTARPADLELYRPGHDNQGYVGQIRLWKAATRTGQAAIGFRPAAGTPGAAFPAAKSGG